MSVKIPTITGPQSVEGFCVYAPRTNPIMELRGFEAGHHRHTQWQLHVSKQRELQRVIEHLRQSTKSL